MEKHFNKDLILIYEEEQFQSSKVCWICEQLIEDKKSKRSLSHNWKI